MLIDLLKELLLELLRALFLEELCQRVKNSLLGHIRRRRHRRHQALLRWLHVRRRDRLLHRITTETTEEL